MNVVSYNMSFGVFHPRKLSAIADALRPIEADLIALQRVDNGVARSGAVNQVKILAELLGLPFSVFSATQAVEGGGETGNGVLSRYPLTGITVTQLPGNEEEEPADAHTITHVAVAHPDSDFLLLNTALGTTAALRGKQLEIVSSIVAGRKDAHEPVLLAGSFHAELGKGELQTLRTFLRDAHSGLDQRITCHRDAPNPAGSTIDYLFYSEHFALKRAEIITSAGAASKHYPLFAALNHSQPVSETTTA